MKIPAKARRIALLTTLLATAIAPLGAIGARAGTTPNWKYVWGGTFSGGLDAQKWGVVEGLVNDNLGSDQAYASFDAAAQNGNLVITTEKRQYGSKAYTSGMVWTKGRYSFTYGKIEVRAKIPAMGLGIWPAMWLQGNVNSAWPGPGGNEIDFAELWNSPNIVNNALHYGDLPASQGGTDLGKNQGCTGSAAFHSTVPLSAAFHTYSLVWQPGPTLTYYVDGAQTCQVSLTGNYFNTPMYIVLNTAVGASWIGHPDASTPFPQQFEINSVSVYQDQNL